MRRGRSTFDKIISRSSEDIPGHSNKPAKMKARVSFPKLNKRDNEHDGTLASSKPMFSHLSVCLNWINNWVFKKINSLNIMASPPCIYITGSLQEAK